MNAMTAPRRDVLTVSQLNREVKQVLEGSFPLLWVEGEISNLARPASGHLYFSLKDAKAQVRCAMFRMRNRLVDFVPENGMLVLIRASIGLYEARGEYQLIVEHMEPAGDGALRRAFDQLKARLDAQGLFAPEHKQPLPAFPKQVGVITSATGAAVRDILHVLQRRYPALPVVIYPVPVQGEGAAQQIANMIALANQRSECDVLILARGGGSLEDLWAFNEEVVARAVYESTLPIVCGVGHEIDFTIADFVADVRAPTPSAAAELVSPDTHALLQGVRAQQDRLAQRMQQQLRLHRRHLDSLRKHLQHPGRRLQTIAQRLDELEQRLQHGWRQRARHTRQQLATLQARLQQHTPAHRLGQYRMQQQALGKRLARACQHTLTTADRRLAQLAHTLDAVSPLATLGRGYAIVRDEQGKLVRDVAGVAIGDTIEAQLHKGRLRAEVKDKSDA
ncbi:MAG: exodeoxyribonuclease VII large subunit [Granulosicoccaceae bacterium]